MSGNENIKQINVFRSPPGICALLYYTHYNILVMDQWVLPSLETAGV